MPDNPITPKLIDHVVIRVSRLEPALAFYRDVIGCSIEKEQAGIGLYQLRAGQSLIDLVDVDGHLGQLYSSAPARNAPNMDHFCLQVDPWNADAIIAHLKSHGVVVGDVEQRYGARGYGPSLYINDPEGNTVELKGPPAAT
ncbi:MAG: VOC family protein [Woeseiaceae bacterium]|nr:VOC family protein [Woeseiaceae bacterium]